MKRKIKKSTQNKKQPHWGDNYCIRAKFDKLLSLRHFRQTNTSEALTSYINKRKQFKLVCKLKKVNFKSQRRQKLVSVRKSSKKFWQYIKGNTYSENTVNKIKAEDWQNHFKQLFTQQSANDLGQSVENPLQSQIKRGRLGFK